MNFYHSTTLFIVLIGALIAGCSGNGGPEKNAKAFLQSLEAEDFEGAKKVSTDETHKLLDLIKMMSSDKPKTEGGEKKDIKVSPCKIDGETATCEYCCDENGNSQQLTLLQKDGEWKVNMTKESIMGDAMEGLTDPGMTIDTIMNGTEDETQTDGTDSTQL